MNFAVVVLKRRASQKSSVTKPWLDYNYLLIGIQLEVKSTKGKYCFNRWVGRTFNMKLSSGCRCKSIAACFTVLSKSASRLRGTSRAGNRSPISPMNTGVSSVTILGMLKSRNALIRTSSSGLPGSPRWKHTFIERESTRTSGISYTIKGMKMKNKLTTFLVKIGFGHFLTSHSFLWRTK